MIYYSHFQVLCGDAKDASGDDITVGSVAGGGRSVQHSLIDCHVKLISPKAQCSSKSSFFQLKNQNLPAKNINFLTKFPGKSFGF